MSALKSSAMLDLAACAAIRRRARLRPRGVPVARRGRGSSSGSGGRARRRCSRDGTARRAPASVLCISAHDQPSSVSAVTSSVVRQAVALDDQRVIARRLERAVDAAEHACAAVADLGELAVHRQRRAHDLAAEGLADRLMAEADAEDRDRRPRPLRSGRGRCRPRSACRGRARARSPRAPAPITSSTVILSLRCTATSAPSSPR